MESEDQIQEAKPRKRGPKPIEPKWTRVIKLEEFMDEEPPIFPIIKDKNGLLSEIEDDDTVIREKKGLIITHDGLKEDEDELRLVDHKTLKPDLEVLATKLIEIRKQIQEKAKRHEESI